MWAHLYNQALASLSKYYKTKITNRADHASLTYDYCD